MSFRIEKLDLVNYRNYDSASFPLGEGITIITGPNAVGKTNLVEALRFLTTGESFRRPDNVDVIRWGCDQASISFNAHDGKRELVHALQFTDRRTFFQNGKRKRVVDACGQIPSVLFTPDDLRIVKDSADRRRASLDSMGVQLSATYRSVKSDYEKVVKQRNLLLKDENADAAILDSWTESLVSLGSLYYSHRRSLFERIKVRFVEVYRNLISSEEVTLEYVPSWVRYGYGPEEDPADVMRRAEERLLPKERIVGSTFVGPHKDEVLFIIDGRDARKFASQGQQRMLVLAWKLAEVEVMEDIDDQTPLLLLDDVMSELDVDRRSSLMDFISDKIQTVITTTNMDYFSDDMLATSKVIRL